MMRGQRVLVSGMGSELGSLVASMLEAEPWVGALEGIDFDPPRRRLRRAVFHRIEPHQHRKVSDVVTAFNPHVVVHVAMVILVPRTFPTMITGRARRAA